MKTSKGYIKELDYIRALSIIFVVLYHYTTRYQEAYGHVGSWPVNFPWGCWGVNTLFVLTAYLTVRNFSSGGFKFLYKRFARLWPAYAVCVVITSVFMFFLLPERLCSLKDIILNFTMFPSYLGAASVDGAYWTLPVEILFYFIIAVFMATKKEKFFLFCLNAWTVIMLVISVCTFVGFEPTVLKLVRMLLVSERGHCFVIGCVIALLEKNKERKYLLYTMPMLALSVIMAVINMGWAVAIWTCLWSLLLYLISQQKLRFALPEKNIIGKAVAFVASVAYPLYLVHQNVGFAIINSLEKNVKHGGEWIIFIPIAVSLIIAVLVHHFVELPAAKLLLGLQTKHKNQNACKG